MAGGKLVSQAPNFSAVPNKGLAAACSASAFGQSAIESGELGNFIHIPSREIAKITGGEIWQFGKIRQIGQAAVKPIHAHRAFTFEHGHAHRIGPTIEAAAQITAKPAAETCVQTVTSACVQR